MVTFDFLWDPEANLLAIHADIGGPARAASGRSQREADYLMIVSGPLPEGGRGTLSVLPIHPCKDCIRSSVVVALPSPLDGPVQYDVQVEDAGAEGGDFFEQDTVVVDPSIGPAPASALSRKWSIHSDANGPYLRIADEAEDVPDDAVSDVFISRRSGTGLYPAEVGGTQGIAPPLLVREGVEGAPPIDPGQAPPRIIEIVKRAGVGSDHRLKVFSLKAAAHVTRLLQEGDPGVPTHLNHQKANLRSNGTATFLFPLDGSEEAADKNASYRPSLLDRIVIQVTPPIELTLEGADQIIRPFGKDGVGILAIDEKGGVQPDDGLLVDKVRAGLDAADGQDTFDFVTALSDHGYKISPSDLNLGCPITVFLFATVCRRIEDLFKNSGSALRPGTFAEFRDASDFYTALAGLVPDQVDRRTASAIRKRNGGSPSQLFGALCRQMLRRVLDDDRQIGEIDEGFKNLENWTENGLGSHWGLVGAAFSPVVQELVRNGIDPGPMMLSPLDIRQELEEVEDFGRLLGQLRQAGMVPDLVHGAFSDFESYGQDARRLRRIKSDAIRAVRDLSHDVSLRAFLPEVEDDLFHELLSVRPDHGNRAQRYLAEQIERSVGDVMPNGPGAGFAERAGALLFKPIASDYEVISSLVAKDISDPIELSSEDTESRGIRDMSIGFMRGLSESEKAWVRSDEPTAPLISRWRWRLRQSIEKADRRVEDGN